MEQTPPPPTPPNPQPSEAQQQPPPPAPMSTTSDVSSPALPTQSTAMPLAPTSTSPLPSLPYPTQNPDTPPTPVQSQTTTPQVRPAPYNRPWPQQQQQQPQPTPSSQFSHFPMHPPPHSSSAVANPTSASMALLPPSQRGGMALGVPAAAQHPGAPSPTVPNSFPSHNSSSFAQPYGGMGRGLPDSGQTLSSPQVRPMMGALGSSSVMRPPASGTPHQLRPGQSSPRPQFTPNLQSPAAQGFLGHGMLRGPAVGTPGAPSPGSSQNPQTHNQPWLNASSQVSPQVKPPLPPSHKPQVTAQSMQQRSHIPSQHQNTMSAMSQQQQVSQAQQSQQPSTSGPPEHHGQPFSQSRIQQSVPNQQLIARSPSLGTQRASQPTSSSTAVQSNIPVKSASVEPEEPCHRILRKRSIQELVTQVDPFEKLDPDVEDILVDIAEDFVESITSFGCSLAKHRKSTTLEAKDILLHLERNWNVTLPGFGGDEIKTYKKPFITDIHKERLAVIKKSILAGETVNSKSVAGQAGGNPKSHVAKGPSSLVGSPPTKVREAG